MFFWFTSSPAFGHLRLYVWHWLARVWLPTGSLVLFPPVISHSQHMQCQTLIYNYNNYFFVACLSFPPSRFLTIGFHQVLSTTTYTWRERTSLEGFFSFSGSTYLSASQLLTRYSCLFWSPAGTANGIYMTSLVFLLFLAFYYMHTQCHTMWLTAEKNKKPAKPRKVITTRIILYSTD